MNTLCNRLLKSVKFSILYLFFKNTKKKLVSTAIQNVQHDFSKKKAIMLSMFFTIIIEVSEPNKKKRESC